MANKTTWAPGQTGNAKGRPPKCRALTDLLTAAGRAKCVDTEGNPIPRNKLLAEMVWLALVSGQITFIAENRRPDEYRSNADTKIFQLRAGDWIEFVKWVFAQVDGDLSVKIDESKTDDDAAAPPPDEAPRAVVILPDNGRSVQRPAEAEAEKQAPQTGTPDVAEHQNAPEQSRSNGADC